MGRGSIPLTRFLQNKIIASSSIHRQKTIAVFWAVLCVFLIFFAVKEDYFLLRKRPRGRAYKQKIF